MSKPTFIVELARHASSGERLATLVSGPVARIQRYVPTRLIELLREMGIQGEPIEGAVSKAQTAVEAWQNPDREPVDLDALRALIHQVVRVARDQGEVEVADELAVLLPRFGLSR